MCKFFVIGIIIGVVGGLVWKEWCKYVDDLLTLEDIIGDEYENWNWDD